MRRLLRVLAILMAVQFLWIAPARAVDVRPLEDTDGDNCANSDTLWDYELIGTNLWDDAFDGSTRRAFVAAGVTSWNTGKDFDGTGVVSVVAYSGSTVRRHVKIYLDWSPGTIQGAPAFTDWGSTYTIEIQAGFPSGEDFVDTIRHEMGHVFGMEHVGDTHSFDGQVPSLATCGPNTHSSSYTQDDEENLFDKKQENGKSNTANPGFERGTTYWAAVSGNVTHYVDSGAFLGDHYVGFKPDGNAERFYQSSAVMHSGGAFYRSKAAIKVPAAGLTGVAVLEILGETFADPTVICYGGPVPFLVENGMTRPSSLTVRKTKTASYLSTGLSTSWQFIETDPYELVSSQYNALRIAFRSSIANASGVRQQLYIDNARVRLS